MESDQFPNLHPHSSNTGTSSIASPSSLVTTPSGDGQSYTSSKHNTAVLGGLNELRKCESLCDVHLMVDEKKFSVHRAVLASCSPYFRSMFTSEMKESQQEVIEFHGFSAIGLQAVLDFIYTSSVHLTVQNMQDILAAANHLQILSVVEFCCEFLQMEICAQNCVDISKIAKFFNLTEVEKCVRSYILANFTQFVHTDEFLRLSQDYICALLSSNNIRGHSEMELFEAAHRWLTHDSSRNSSVFSVMQHIRFPLISPDDIDEKVHKITSMQSDPDCLKLLLEATKYHMLPYKQPLLNSVRTQVRSVMPCLVAIGGKESTNHVSREVQLFNKEASHWLHLGKMDLPAYCHCVAVMNDFLFVVGGQEMFDNNGSTAMSNVYRYDPRFNSWLKMENMLETRTDFHVSAIDGYLYAIAGRNHTGPLSSAERFKVDQNRWEPISDLPHAVCAHSGAPCCGLMYIAGGFATDGFQREVYCYHPRENKWEAKPKLKTERGLHCMVDYKERLYCIGGNNKTNGARRDVLTTEMFDVGTQQWTEVAPLFAGQSEAGAAVVGGKIYVVGGHTWRERKDVRTVACYDPERDTWEKATDFPEPLTSVSCCALRIPATLLSGLRLQQPRLLNNSNENLPNDEDIEMA
ncbi:unnamed protein product [Clavelina lepadiformis]|uniref:BTB domain-containing protein n=1 Tax=Clavelina lepadiformis TaxID=159417 RepID=A0ABP0H5A8_CLALP